MPASGPRHARGPLPSPIRPSKRPLPIHSARCATYGTVTPGQLPYRPVGLGRPTGRSRHRAHGTSAAHGHRRFAHRSGQSRSTAPAVLLAIVASTVTRVPQASCRTAPSAQADGSKPASGPRHARGPLPSPIRPSKRPLPIHSTRCATYYSGLTTRVLPQASCRTVPSAQADGPMPASGPRHVRGPLPSPIRPSKRPLPIHSTRCASYTGAGPRDGTVSLSQLMSSCSQETTARCECRV
jgi:hypothetical protein